MQTTYYTPQNITTELLANFTGIFPVRNSYFCSTVPLPASIFCEKCDAFYSVFCVNVNLADGVEIECILFISSFAVVF